MCTCSSCNSADVAEHSDVEIYTHKDTDYEVLIHFFVCNSCNDEFMNKEQILKNEAAIREGKKEVDGLLSAEELKEIRLGLKLTQEQASEVFGGGRNAFSKYERSEVSQSKSMDKLVRLAGSDRYIFRKLFNLLRIEQRFDFTNPTDLQISDDKIINFPSPSSQKASTYSVESEAVIDENTAEVPMAAAC